MKNDVSENTDNAAGQVRDERNNEALKKLRIVIRAAQRHSAWIERRSGITGAQMWVLAELDETPDLRVGELARLMVMHQATVSNLLDALEKKNLLMKCRHAEDQRVVTLRLTSLGKQVLDTAPSPVRGLLPDALRRMEAPQIELLNRGLEALIKEIDSDEESHGLQPLPFTV